MQNRGKICYFPSTIPVVPQKIAGKRGKRDK